MIEIVDQRFMPAMKADEKQPFALRRLPQHYISAYLGVTDIAFSRFKNKK